MNILCVCKFGNVRSVATRNRLNKRGYRDVISIGVDNTNPLTLKMLEDWADVILVADGWMRKRFDSKVEPDFDIGEDTFGTYNHPDLQLIIDQELNDWLDQ